MKPILREDADGRLFSDAMRGFWVVEAVCKAGSEHFKAELHLTILEGARKTESLVSKLKFLLKFAKTHEKSAHTITSASVVQEIDDF